MKFQVSFAKLFKKKLSSSRSGGAQTQPDAFELRQALFNQHLSPGLRALGFSGSSGKYVLVENGWQIGIGIQSSKYNSSETVELFANVSVYNLLEWQDARALWNSKYEYQLPKEPTLNSHSVASTIQNRIDDLGFGKASYVIRQGSDLTEIASNILGATERLLPYLRDAIHHAESKRLPDQVIIQGMDLDLEEPRLTIYFDGAFAGDILQPSVWRHQPRVDLNLEFDATLSESGKYVYTVQPAKTRQQRKERRTVLPNLDRWGWVGMGYEVSELLFVYAGVRRLHQAGSTVRSRLR